MCRYAYPQEILIQFFFGITHVLNLEIWPKWTTTETVSQYNSSEAAQENFEKLRSNEGLNV